MGGLFARVGGDARPHGRLLLRLDAGEEACIISRGRRRKYVGSEIRERRKGSGVAIAAAERKAG